jgi:hypothetical protein
MAEFGPPTEEIVLVHLIVSGESDRRSALPPKNECSRNRRDPPSAANPTNTAIPAGVVE